MKWFLGVLSIIFLLVVIIVIWLQTDTYPVSPQKSKEPAHQIKISPLTIDQFFDKKTVANEYPQDEVWTMKVTGDIIPARTVNFNTLQKNDFHWAFEPTASFLRSADITYGNLESPIFGTCPVTNVGMIFCGDERHIEGLVYAGIDIVNLANNHLGNHGKEGIEETTAILDNHSIKYAGIQNNPQYLEVKGNKIAFLGYDDVEYQAGVSQAKESQMKSEIQEAGSEADLVIVQFHWGVEYVSQPSDRQKSLAKLAIDSGADLIIGNHPHWIQPVELYKNKLITYAHGNFIFDQMWSEKTKEGVIGTYTFYKNNLIDVEYTPIYIQDFGQARIIDDTDHAQRIVNEMYDESIKLSKVK
jgi:poly-gamma-glutamate synthesis protein (capsule biosynthesis protein)